MGLYSRRTAPYTRRLSRTQGSTMKIMNRLFAAAFVALLLCASYSRAEHEGGMEAAPVCELGEAEATCP